MMMGKIYEARQKTAFGLREVTTLLLATGKEGTAPVTSTAERVTS